MAQVVAGNPPERMSRLLFIAAALFAAIASALIFVALQSRGGSDGTPAAATDSVVVASRDIPANVRLTADMLELKSLPVEAALDDAYVESETLVGLATRFPVARGEQLTRLKLGSSAIEDEDDLARVLPAGMRGFAVEVSEVTGVGGLLLPGNTVDVIAVFDESTAGIGKAVTLLQNIEVLSVAQEAQEPVPAAVPGAEDESADADGAGSLLGRRPDEAERQPGARTVTLAVTPQDAQLLALAQERGKLWLSLRPLDDRGVLWLDERNLAPFQSPVAGESEAIQP